MKIGVAHRVESFDTPMPLPSGTRLGPYEILGPIGAGGMGEVYRAKDTKLDREVATKVLPSALARDPERLARFEREAKVLASLNHPNIAQIYGVEDANGVRALVMELVPGETLKGPLPLETALNYAKQIADALEAAHEKGIIHRDLKPANVMITPSGVVKVLDFGLAAIAQSSAGNGQDPANSPTLTMGATQAGVIMGTAAYMSPEQAVGKPVDRRADIWSFGVLLFEMLTGNRLFEAETTSHTLADVIRAEIDFSKLPKTTPAPVRELIKRCLDRDVKNRLRDIGEARVAIQQYLANPSQAPPQTVTRPAKMPWAVAAAATVAALALGYIVYRHNQEAPPRVVKLYLPPPDKGAVIQTNRPSVAVSPDGQRIAFFARLEGKAVLWLRDLSSPNAQMLVETDFGRGPFWSPDSRFIGFFSADKLMRIDATGGPAQTLCEARTALSGSWNEEDVIIFQGTDGIFRIPAAGGTPSLVTQLDKSRNENSHRFPWFLPDGRHFLYTALTSPDRAKSAVYVGDLASKDRKQVVQAASNALYVSPGYLLFVRNRTLMAQPFDAIKLRTTKDAVPIAEHVNAHGIGYANFSASQDGVLTYNSSDAGGAQLTWFDRSGKALGNVGAPGEMEFISLSPDGSAVVAARNDSQTGDFDLWQHDLTRGADSRLTFTGSSRYPVWSPDGKHIAFMGVRDGVRNVYQKAANGTGQEEILEAANKLPADWSSDGRYLITMTGNSTPKTGNDIWVLPLFGDRKAFPYVQTEFDEFFARLSPDGRWLAYMSHESKRGEIYVVTFPTPGGKWQVSTNGGFRPAWSRDSKELYFVSADQKMMAVEIKPGATFQAGIPKPLFDVRMLSGNNNFEVSKDGHFLIPSIVEQSDGPLTVVLNWPAMLKK